MKLLTFDQSWADEHDVPALACFTDEEYTNWCESSMGKPNLNYDQELIDYDNKANRYKLYHDGMVERGLWHKTPHSLTPEEKQWHEENKENYPSDNPQKADSYIRAYLGNNGEGFGEYYSDYLTGQDLIDNNIVKVFDVSEDFHTTFHRANLSDLSLSNVFTISDGDRQEYEEDNED